MLLFMFLNEEENGTKEKNLEELFILINEGMILKTTEDFIFIISNIYLSDISPHVFFTSKTQINYIVKLYDVLNNESRFTALMYDKEKNSIYFYLKQNNKPGFGTFEVKEVLQ